MFCDADTDTNVTDRYVEGVGSSRGLAWWERRGWLMMLPDMFLRDEERFRSVAEEFREDQELWWSDFARVFKQLTEAGMPPLGTGAL
jgi:hypothetical protein